MIVTALEPGTQTTRRSPRARHYLMCRPSHFDVTYAINPWMDPAVAVDTSRAVSQWETLRRTYLSLGHRVDLIEPIAGLPDMVFAANGGTVIGGRALASRFAFAQRQPEGHAYEAWFRAVGLASLGMAESTNEGEGDFLVAGKVVLAGTGFRTSMDAHRELKTALGMPVVTLTLIDPRFYHLDTALAVLDDSTIAYYPPAFDAASNAMLAERFPDAIIATEADAMSFGLNAVSDGRHVVLADQARGLHDQLRHRGFEPIGVDLSELLKGGGSVKCCTLEIRS